eukprot:TRINITY_DN8716_c0_g1_i1.p1 TRINITY_DN8716_c0_g1~~TRINITY_DN8716_c0_g1_i1.p1  ORF type:complete len:381 (+),score=81.28 TRINITY_DN8716_c0_g1_i1:182-1324(+)
MQILHVSGGLVYPFQDSAADAAGFSADAQDFVPGQSQHCRRKPVDEAPAQTQVLPLSAGRVVRSSRGVPSAEDTANCIGDMQLEIQVLMQNILQLRSQSAELLKTLSQAECFSRGQGAEDLQSNASTEDSTEAPRSASSIASEVSTRGPKSASSNAGEDPTRVHNSALSNAGFGVPQVQVKYAFASLCPNCSQCCHMAMKGTTPASVCLACGIHAPGIPVEWAVTNGDGVWTSYTSKDDAQRQYLLLLATQKTDGLPVQDSLGGGMDDAMQGRTRTAPDLDSPSRSKSSVHDAADDDMQDRMRKMSELDGLWLDTSVEEGVVGEAIGKHQPEATSAYLMSQTDRVLVGQNDVVTPTAKQSLKSSPSTKGPRWCDVEDDDC